MIRLRLFFALLLALGAFVAYYVYGWFRERYSKRGPMPYTQAGILLHPLRRYMHPVRPMLESFGVREGATVLELGPGIGYFTIEASRMVRTSGRVVAVDIQPEMIAGLRKRLDEAGATSAHPAVGSAHDLPLADGSVDVAFLVTVLGEIPDRPRALAELRRVLKPGGQLAFAEHLTDPDYQLEASLRDLCRASGFEETGHERRFLGYTMTFRAP